MRVEQKVNIHNRFDIHIDNIETGEHRELVAYNIVLDQMWTRLCAGDSYFSNIHFGTGNETPVANRTSLFAHLGTKTAVTEETIKALPLSSWKRKIVLNPEEFVGSTITEVGIAFGSTASNLVTHAMLKDSEGNVISITKSDTDIVTIFATVFVTIIETNTKVRLTSVPTSNLLLNYLIGGEGSSYSTFRLGQGIGAQPYSSLGVGLPLLGETNSVSFTADIPNKKRKTPTTRFGISAGNGHVAEMDFKNLFRLELPADGIFTGQAYEGVYLGVGDGVNKEFILPSRNVKSGSLVAKVDGVAAASAQVDYEKNEPNYGIRIPSGFRNVQNSSYSRFIHTKSLNYCVYSSSDGIEIIKDFGTKDMAVVAQISIQNIRMLDVSYDAESIAVGMSGKIRVYDRVDNEYVLQRPEYPSLDNVQGVAISSDGNTIAYGAISDKYEIVDWVSGSWVARPKPTPTPGSHLRDVDLSDDGSVFAAISENSTHGAIYDWDGTVWTRRPSPPSIGLQYPQKVQISGDGLTLSATSANSATYNFAVYDWSGSAWIRRTPSVVRGAVSSAKANISPDFNFAIMNSSYLVELYYWNGVDWEVVPSSFIPNNQSDTIGFRRDNKVIWIPEGLSAPIIFMGTKLTKVVLDVAPTSGKVITADYTVDGVHKTDQYVIDVSFAIQFGEGV